MAAASGIDPLAEEMLAAIRQRRPQAGAAPASDASAVDPLATEMLESIRQQRAAPVVTPPSTVPVLPPAPGAPLPVERLAPAMLPQEMRVRPGFAIPTNVAPRGYNKPQSELDLAQFGEDRKRLPAWMTAPGRAPGIPLQEMEGRERFTTAKWYHEDRPKAIGEMNREVAALAAEREKIDALARAGKRVPQSLLVSYESRRLGIERRNQEIEGFSNRFNQSRAGGRAQAPGAIHGGLFYPEEVARGEGQPGRMQGLLRHVSLSAEAEAQVPAIRASLQWAGKYPPPPPIPYRNREQGIQEMRDLRNVVAIYGDRLRDDGTLAPVRAGFDAGSAYSERVVKNLTPFQRKSIATVRQQIAAERDAYDLAKVAPMLGIDLGAALVSEGVAGIVGAALRGPGKEILKRVAPRLFVRYMAATAPTLGTELLPLSRAALNRLVLRAAPEVAVRTVAGGAAGYAAGAGTGLATGQTLPQAHEMGKKTATVGAVLSGGLSGLTSALSGTLRGGWNPKTTPRLIERVVEDARQQGLVTDTAGFAAALTRVAKAPAVARGRLLRQAGEEFGLGAQPAQGPARGAGAPRPSAQTEVIPPDQPAATPRKGKGPIVTNSQGQEIALRETPRETLAQVAQSGDPRAAAAAQHWLDQAEAHDVQMEARLPDDKAARDVYAKAWLKSESYGWHKALSEAATMLGRTNPILSARLQQAAFEAHRNFLYSHVRQTAPELSVEPTVPPPTVSLWRQLSPAEQDALPPGARKALLALDLSNSLVTVDPTREPVQRLGDEGSYRKEGALREAADQTFETAQTVAARRFVPPAVQEPEIIAPPDRYGNTSQDYESGDFEVPTHEDTLLEREIDRGNEEMANAPLWQNTPVGEPQPRREPITIDAAPPLARMPVETPQAPVTAPEVAPGAVAPTLPKTPTRPLWEMGLEELEAAEEVAKVEDRALLVRLFGEEGSHRYRALDAKANSNYASGPDMDAAWKQIEQMEATLTPAERDRLHGIGEADTPSVDDIREYRRALDQLDTDSAAALGDSLKWAVTKVGQETDPAKMTHEERVAYATLREGFRFAQEQGFDTAEVTQAAIRGSAGRFRDPEDAAFMLRRFINKAPAAEAPQTPALPAPPPAEANLPADLGKVGAARTRAAGQARAVGVRAGAARVKARAEADPPDKAQNSPDKVETPPDKPVAPQAEGVDTQFKAGDETHAARWAVYDVGDLVTSHTDVLNENPAYPKDLQPRDRTRQASREQIAEMAQKLDPRLMGENPLAQHGAPIIGPDAVVESGNARTIALRHAYEQNGEAAGRYREWLAKNGGSLGINAADLEGIQRPVLVRVRTSELTPEQRVQFTRTANARETAAMGATEQAKADAERMTPALMSRFDVGESGEIGAATNRAFVREFIGALPTAEQGAMRTAEGGISQEGMRRIRNAVFFHAYGDAEALTRLAEAVDDPARNITNGMLRAAGVMVDLRERIAAETVYPVEIAGDVAKAAGKIAVLRENGDTVTGYLAQIGMFGPDLTPIQRSILVHLDENKRSPKRIAATLADYADLAVKAGDPSSGILFEDIAPPEKATLWQAALERNERMAQREPGFFAEGEGAVAPQPATAEAPRPAAGPAAGPPAAPRSRAAQAGAKAEAPAETVAPKPAAKPRAKKPSGDVKLAGTGQPAKPSNKLASPVREKDLERVEEGIYNLHRPGVRSRDVAAFMKTMAPQFKRAFDLMARRVFTPEERAQIERVGLTTVESAHGGAVFGLNLRLPDGRQWIFANPFLQSGEGATTYRHPVVNTLDTADNLAESMARVTLHEMAHFNVREEGGRLWDEMDRLRDEIGDEAYDRAVDILRGAVTKRGTDDFSTEYRKGRAAYLSAQREPGSDFSLGDVSWASGTGPEAGQPSGGGVRGREGGAGANRGADRQVAPQEQQRAGKKPPTSFAKYEGPSDPNLRRFTQENRAVSTSEPLATRIKREAQDWHNFMFRKRATLPNIGKYAELARKIDQATDVGRRTSQDEAQFSIMEALDGLDKGEMAVFSDTMLLRDMLRGKMGLLEQEKAWVDAGNDVATFKPTLPVEVTKAELTAELANLEAIAAQSPRVSEALKRLVEMRKRVYQPFMDNFRDVFGYEPQFSPEDYMRRKVIAARAGQRGGLATGSRFFSRKPSTLKGRTAHALAWDTDFVTAELDYLPEIIHYTKVLDLYRHVRDTMDQTPELARRALDINDDEFAPYLEQLARLAKPGGALDVRKHQPAVRKLTRYAAEGGLPDTQNGRFEPLLQELATNGQLNLEREAMGLPALGLHADAMAGIPEYANWLLDEGRAPNMPRSRQTATTRATIRKHLGREFVDPKDLIPEGSRKWNPDPSSIFRHVASVQDELIKAVRKGVADEINVALDKIRQGGGLRRELILENEVADTLDTLLRPNPNARMNPAVRALSTAQRKIKGGMLTLPDSAVGYYLGNFFGDNDRAFRALGLPKTAAAVQKYAASSTGMVNDLLFRQRIPHADLRELINEGGRASIQTQAEEIGGGVDLIGRYSLRKQSPLVRLWNIGGNIRNVPHDARELSTQLTLYRYLRDYIQKHDKVPTYGASRKEVVDALETPQAKAYRLSRDMLIDYESTTEMGQFIARYIFPFYRYVEGSFRYEYRMLSNAIGERRVAGHVGRTLVDMGKRSPVIAWQLGRFYMYAIAATIFWDRLNNALFPEEEQQLDERTRNRPHITYRNPVTGEINTFTRFQSMNDVLAWGNLDNVNGYLEAINNGRMTPMEAVKDAAPAPVNRFLQGLGPQYRILPMAGGMETFPDVFQPRKSRDPWEQFFATANLDIMYRWARGIPQRKNTWNRAFFASTRQDFSENAYHEMRGYAKDWLQKKGKGSDFGGGDSNAKQSAMYWFTQSARTGDAIAQRYYLGQYGREGGKDSQFQQSLANLDPLGMMKSVDREAFLSALSPADQARMRQAYYHWQNLVAPTLDMTGMEGLPIQDFVAAMRQDVRDEIKQLTPVEDAAEADPEIRIQQDRQDEEKQLNRELQRSGY